MKKFYLGIFVSLILVATYIIILFVLSYQNAIYLTIEDGFTEWLSVICCSLSACIFFCMFYKSSSKNVNYLFKTNQNYFLLLLGLFCILIIGEEINWGQRIWGLRAPEWILEKESNEMNLHNIDTLFIVAGIRITAGRIFFSFVILYFMVIPIIGYFSSMARGFFKRINLPIVPTWLAIYFIINFVLFQIINRIAYPTGYNEISFGQTNMEIYEINFAILLLWTSIVFYQIEKKDYTAKSSGSNT